MKDIKCFENYIQLRKMLEKGEKGDAGYFSQKLNISERTLRRMMLYLFEIEGIEVKFSRVDNSYYIDRF